MRNLLNKNIIIICLNLLFCLPLFSQVTTGQIAPVFNLRNIKGELVKPFQEPGLIIISFFFTDCPNCKKEIKNLEELYQKYNDKVTIYLVGTSFKKDVDIPDDVEKFIKNLNVNFIPLVDKYKEVISAYGITNYPSIFMIDKKGRIIFTSVSYKDATIDELEKQIKKAK